MIDESKSKPKKEEESGSFSILNSVLIFGACMLSLTCLVVIFLICCRFLSSRIKKNLRRTYVAAQEGPVEGTNMQ